jgi:AcrR family transcriptional regulator
VTVRPAEHRAGSSDADSPAEEDDARERLLAAADACYADKGLVRTRMSDIAERAGVHRSTVCYHFSNRDALLAAPLCEFLLPPRRPLTMPADRRPISGSLVAACLRGTDIARSSPMMRSLIEERQALGVAYHAAERSELWRAKLADTLVRRLEAAAAAGEIRRDVPADTLARWIVQDQLQPHCRTREARRRW